MLRLTRDGEYAIRAILHLSREFGKGPSLLTDISRTQEVPRSYLSKIMQRLCGKGLVVSRRGPSGGFTLARPAETIYLIDVIEAVEGRIFLNNCLVRKGECSRDDMCPVHLVWREAQERMKDVLKGKNMADLVKEADAMAMSRPVSVAAGEPRTSRQRQPLSGVAKNASACGVRGKKGLVAE